MKNIPVEFDRHYFTCKALTATMQVALCKKNQKAKGGCASIAFATSNANERIWVNQQRQFLCGKCTQRDEVMPDDLITPEQFHEDALSFIESTPANTKDFSRVKA